MSDIAKFRKARERAAADGQVARMLGDGNPMAFPHDRFQKPMRPGSMILFRPTFDFVYEVVSVDPVIDPTVPAGHIRMTLLSQTTLTVPVGQAIMSAVLLESPKPSAQGDGDPGEAEPPAEPEPTPEPGLVQLTDVQ